MAESSTQPTIGNICPHCLRGNENHATYCPAISFSEPPSIFVPSGSSGERPTFDQLLNDPLQQFTDPELTKAVMRSIEEYRDAPSNTISVPSSAVSPPGDERHVHCPHFTGDDACTICQELHWARAEIARLRAALASPRVLQPPLDFRGSR